MNLRHLIKLLQSHATVYGPDAEVFLQINDQDSRMTWQGSDLLLFKDENIADPTVIVVCGVRHDHKWVSEGEQ